MYISLHTFFKLFIIFISLTLYSHGRDKFWTGAGLYGLGAVTGNNQLKNVGGGLAQLGLLTKVGAHFF